MESNAQRITYCLDSLSNLSCEATALQVGRAAEKAGARKEGAQAAEPNGRMAFSGQQPETFLSERWRSMVEGRLFFGLNGDCLGREDAWEKREVGLIFLRWDT